MPTLNFTHNNIQHHARTRKTAPKTPYRTSNSALTANRKAQLQPQKIFHTHTNRPSDNNGYIINNPSSHRRPDRDDDGLQKQATKYGFADSPTVRMKKFWSGQQKEKPVGRRFNSCRPHQNTIFSEALILLKGCE